MEKERKTTSRPAPYRWSPHPASHYADACGAWLLKLSPVEWNLAWLALPNLDGPAPPGFRDAVKRSVGCAASVPTHQEVLHLSMRQMLDGQAVGFVHLSAAVTWRTTPPIMELIPGWKSAWLTRAKQARTEHPAALNRMIDDDVRDVTAARNLITAYGWCRNLE